MKSVTMYFNFFQNTLLRYKIFNIDQINFKKSAWTCLFVICGS
jgi:hypothetical protein